MASIELLFLVAWIVSVTGPLGTVYCLPVHVHKRTDGRRGNFDIEEQRSPISQKWFAPWSASGRYLVEREPVDVTSESATTTESPFHTIYPPGWRTHSILQTQSAEFIAKETKLNESEESTDSEQASVVHTTDTTDPWSLVPSKASVPHEDYDGLNLESSPDATLDDKLDNTLDDTFDDTLDDTAALRSELDSDLDRIRRLFGWNSQTMPMIFPKISNSTEWSAAVDKYFSLFAHWIGSSKSSATNHQKRIIKESTDLEQASVVHTITDTADPWSLVPPEARVTHEGYDGLNQESSLDATLYDTLDDKLDDTFDDTFDDTLDDTAALRSELDSDLDRIRRLYKRISNSTEWSAAVDKYFSLHAHRTESSKSSATNHQGRSVLFVFIFSLSSNLFLRFIYNIDSLFESR